MLADPQHALDLTATADPDDQPAEPTGQPNDRVPRRTVAAPALHLHLHTDALTTGTGVARVEDLGPRALEAVRRWLTDLAPGTTLTLTPVIDTTEHLAVDSYEIPDRLRRQLTQAQPHCRFPWCARPGRHDLDHIDRYVHGSGGPGEPGGPPPGQTNSHNLARLCRFHHRVKTRGAWHYQRQPDGI